MGYAWNVAAIVLLAMASVCQGQPITDAIQARCTSAPPVTNPNCDYGCYCPPGNAANGWPQPPVVSAINGCSNGCAPSPSTYPCTREPVICDAPLVRELAGIYAGFEFLWLRASFDQNVAMIIDPPVGNRMVPFDYDFQLSPRAWLGWQACNGTGFRSTYFYYDDSADTERATAVAGATPVFLFVEGAGGNLSRNAYADLGETLVSNHDLTLQALDLEATQSVVWCEMRALFGCGVRIAKMEQHLRADVYDAVGGLEEAVTNDLQFTGAGPTASAMLSRRLWASRFSVFSNMRGSLLASETEQRIYEMKNAGTNELVDIADQREVLGNVEMSVGLQFGQSLGRSAGVFIRTGYECQLWLDEGGPVDSTSTITLDGITFAIGVSF